MSEYPMFYTGMKGILIVPSLPVGEG